MKNYILAAVAASVIGVSAPAFADNSSHACGAFDNEIRFNPTELSDFQECWLNFHKPDEMSGTLGSLFWVKVGDEFVSMPVKSLVREGSAEKAKELVVDRVLDPEQRAKRT